MRQLDNQRRSLSTVESVEGMSKLKQRAYGLLGSATSQRAFDLGREKPEVRDHYGRHKFGQSLLLARRLAEAGVPIITVNWSKLNADQWDTHKNNYATLKTKLLPPYDQGLAALLADLDDRGLQQLVLQLQPVVEKVCGRKFQRPPVAVLPDSGDMMRVFRVELEQLVAGFVARRNGVAVRRCRECYALPRAGRTLRRARSVDRHRHRREGGAGPRTIGYGQPCASAAEGHWPGLRAISLVPTRRALAAGHDCQRAS